MKILPIKTKSKHYNIYIGHNIISKLNLITKKEKIGFEKSLIVYDQKVPKKFLEKIKSRLNSDVKLTFLFKASEKNKNIKYVQSLLEILFKNNLFSNKFKLFVSFCKKIYKPFNISIIYRE